MAIRRVKRASPYEVYWNNPYTKKRESTCFATLTEARKHDSLIKHQLKFEKESFKPEDHIEESSLAVSDICAMYLQAKQFTGRNLKLVLGHLKPVFAALGKHKVSSLEKRDLTLFMAEASAKGIKTTTSYRRLSVLRAALSWAADMEMIERNPLLGIKIPHGQTERIAPPTPAEVAAILAVSKGYLYRAIKIGVLLGIRTGSSELFRLKWEDVDFDRATVRVWSAAKNPNCPYRDVPIRDGFISEIKAWWTEDMAAGIPYIFHLKNGKQAAGMKSCWPVALKRAGITRRIRPYDLRHAFATNALDYNADLKAIADIMGHANPNMVLSTYQHTSQTPRRQAVQAFHGIPAHVDKNVDKKK